MPFQKAHASIVRSIRQVSLLREWHRARRDRDLPDISDFVPDERAGDAADILIAQVQRADGAVRYHCHIAGERVQQLYGRAMPGLGLHDCLDRPMADAARPIWDACINHRLPVYTIIALADANGCPVTVEQIFLPYRGNTGVAADFMLAGVHAWSTEGRFVSQGLLRGVTKIPLHWAVIIDPAMKRESGPARAADADDVVFDDTLAPSPAR